MSLRPMLVAGEDEDEDEDEALFPDAIELRDDACASYSSAYCDEVILAMSKSSGDGYSSGPGELYAEKKDSIMLPVDLVGV